MLINPGIFKKKIKIIGKIISKDTDGFPIAGEKIMTSTWAQVTNISGTELQKANSDFSQVKTRFFMRTPKILIDHDWIIEFGNNRYNIVYINDYRHEKKYMEIIAELVQK